MASVDKGEALLWGVDTGVITNAIITSINFDKEFANVGALQDEVGNVIHERLCDIHTTGSATMVFTADPAKDLTDAADEFTYDSVVYYITELTKTKSNNGFQEISVNFEYIDYTTNAA